MLILTRRPGQVVRIFPRASLDPNTPVRELFQQGPIEVIVTRVDGANVRLGIVAHTDLMILRDDAVGIREDPAP